MLFVRIQSILFHAVANLVFLEIVFLALMSMNAFQTVTTAPPMHHVSTTSVLSIVLATLVFLEMDTRAPILMNAH